jgi:quinol-cytochrome oxidoreductase complex cytochrome b subunit
MSFQDVWSNRGHVTRVFSIILFLYFIAAVIVLSLAFGLIPAVPEAKNNPYLLIIFAIVSFALTVVISAYHLSTQIRRRKRKTDV